MAGPDRRPRGRVPRRDRIEPEDGAQQLGAAGADEAGDAEDLAAAKGEAAPRGLRDAGEVVDLEQITSPGVRGERG